MVIVGHTLPAGHRMGKRLLLQASWCLLRIRKRDIMAYLVCSCLLAKYPILPVVLASRVTRSFYARGFAEVIQKVSPPSSRLSRLQELICPHPNDDHFTSIFRACAKHQL